MLKSVFNAEGLRVIIQVVHVGTVKTYVAPAEAIRERKDTMKVYNQNCWKKLVWVPVSFFAKIVIPSYKFDAIVLTPTRRTLRITLMFTLSLFPYFLL